MLKGSGHESLEGALKLGIGLSNHTVSSYHTATFETLVAHECMFHIVRIVVDYTSIIDTYRAIQTRCRSSMPYSPCVIVTVMHSN